MDPAKLQGKMGPDMEVIRSLGEGSVASVVLARELPLRRLVAVKILRPELVRDEITRRRFLREARSAARIAHPNVVSVFRVGAFDDETPYIVMEYVEGRTLDAVLKAEGRMDSDRARTVVTELARALDAAHGHGIVHRDLRPGNVLIATSGRVVLSDFGIAGILESGTETITRITQAGQLLGETRYTSPEQLRGERVTAAADLYSLAVTGYEMLTLELPWPDRGPAALVRAHLMDEPRPLESLRPDVDRTLADILRRCLAKEPTHRPRAADVARQLQAPEGAGGRSAVSPDTPLSGFHRFMEEIKRRRVGKVGIGYFVFILGVGAFSGEVLGQMNVGPAVQSALVAVVVAAFPVVLVLSWMYDWTPQGIRRTETLTTAENRVVVRTLQLASLALSLLIAGFILWWSLGR